MSITEDPIQREDGNYHTLFPVRHEPNVLCLSIRVGEDTFKKYLKIQILYTQTYIFTDRQY